jgi:hypothetical protein
MSDIVLRGGGLALDTDTGRRFVSDLAEFADGTISESMVRRRWRLDEATLPVPVLRLHPTGDRASKIPVETDGGDVEGTPT